MNSLEALEKIAVVHDEDYFDCKKVIGNDLKEYNIIKEYVRVEVVEQETPDKKKYHLCNLYNKFKNTLLMSFTISEEQYKSLKE